MPTPTVVPTTAPSSTSESLGMTPSCTRANAPAMSAKTTTATTAETLSIPIPSLLNSVAYPRAAGGDRPVMAGCRPLPVWSIVTLPTRQRHWSPRFRRRAAVVRIGLPRGRLGCGQPADALIGDPLNVYLATRYLGKPDYLPAEGVPLRET